MQWLLEHRPDVFEGIAYGITEGGLTEMTGEEMTWFGIEIGGKQYVQAFIAAPERADILRARVALEPYIFSRWPGRLLPEIRTHLAHLSQSRVQFREPLSDVDATIRKGEFWRLPPTYRDLVQNSLVTGPPEQRNGEWRMLITLLNLPDEDPDARIAWLRKTVEPAGARLQEIVAKEGPVPLSSPDTPLFTILASEARERYKTATGIQVLYRSTSDARFLRTRGIDVYGVSPYAANYYQSISIHNANEAITVGAFQEGVEYTREVVREWASR